MKTIAKGALTTILLTALFVVYALPAQADQVASQSSNISVTCTSGDYGQSNNCYAISNQSIVQNQTKVLGLRHTPVNAGMDQTTAMAAIGTLISTGTGALFAFRKLRA